MANPSAKQIEACMKYILRKMSAKKVLAKFTPLTVATAIGCLEHQEAITRSQARTMNTLNPYWKS
jgi:hypothetical protein